MPDFQRLTRLIVKHALEKAWYKRVCRILVAQHGAARAQTSPSSRLTRPKSSCACSTSEVNVNLSASHSLNTPTRFGTVICLTLDLPLFMDTASMGLMSRRPVSDLIPISFCSILMPVLTQVN